MATNQVTVSAVPFNQQTQTFQSVSPAPVNTPKIQPGVPTAAQNLAAFNQSMVNSANTYKAPTSSNIDVNNLGTQPINVPYQQSNLPEATPNYATSTIQQSQTKDPNTPVSNAATGIYDLMSQVLPQTLGQKQEYQNQLGTQVTDANKQIMDWNTQLVQRQNELNQLDTNLAAGLANIQDQAIPMSFITGQQLSVENRANIARGLKQNQIANLNTSILVAQGNIALAKQNAQDAVDKKYGPIQEVYDALQKQLTAITPFLNREDKQIADAKTAQAKVQSDLIAQKKVDDKSFMDLVLKAPTEYGASAQQVNEAINTYNKTGDVFQATQALMGYGGSQIQNAYNTANSARNAATSGIGQITVDNGYTLEDFKKGIASTESSNNYKAIGPATSSGDKAYGKYQVMGVNIPSWTKEALGYSMTPTQFLNSPDAQEKVFEFQSMQNYSKYGNWDDVASVWFSGKPLSGNNASDGYNTVPAYVAKVRQAMGVPSQPTALSLVTNPSVVTWANSVRAGGDIKDVPKALQTQVLAYNQQNVQNNPQTQNIVEKINQIDNIINNPALSSVVGPNIFGRGVFANVASGAVAGATAGAIGGSFVTPLLGTAVGGVLGGLAGAGAGYATTNQFSGQAQNFIADVEQLTSKETLDTLINAKAKGATFGALSIPELALLQQSATKINKWAMHVDNDPNKPVIGYNTDEQSFLKELEQVKRLAQKGIATAGGNILGNTIGGAYATSLIQSQNSTTAMNTLNYGFK